MKCRVRDSERGGWGGESEGTCMGEGGKGVLCYKWF